jgi:S1-C subfamily serine protease
MPLLFALALLAAAPPQPPAAPAPLAPASPSPGATPPQTRATHPWCSAAYADNFAALSPEALAQANRPEASFTYCLRVTATYECLSYASDGSVRRSLRSATAHGTAFAYRRQGQDTLLLTNQHVAEYAPVTDEEHPVAGVPLGCKRVSDSLKIVDNERDTFEADDLPLSRVVVDGALDMAVVKAHGALNVMPWKIGRSSALRERNVVEVKGFPLGAFRTTVQGRVTSVYDHDDFKDWNHDDFIIDAQLSSGNSGSPVLAVSCETGAYELVGIFHADYSRGSSLNVVVHVDGVRELMTTLKRTSATRPADDGLSIAGRRRLVEEAQQTARVFFAFGPAPAELRARDDGALVFSVFHRDFPARGWPLLVLEDLEAGPGLAFGQLDHVWFGNARGLKERRLQELEEADRAAVERALEGLRRTALMAVQLRSLTVRASSSREAAEDLVRVERELKRLTAAHRDLAQGLADDAERLGPATAEEAIPPARPFVHAAAAESSPPAPPPTPGAP